MKAHLAKLDPLAVRKAPLVHFHDTLLLDHKSLSVLLAGNLEGFRTRKLFGVQVSDCCPAEKETV